MRLHGVHTHKVVQTPNREHNHEGMWLLVIVCVEKELAKKPINLPLHCDLRRHACTPTTSQSSSTSSPLPSRLADRRKLKFFLNFFAILLKTFYSELNSTFEVSSSKV